MLLKKIIKHIKRFAILLVAFILLLTILAWHLSFAPISPEGQAPEWWLKQRPGAYHVHTKFSHDSKGEPAAIVKALQVNNLGFAIISDHDAIGIKKTYIAENLLIAPGVETSTADGHMVLINPQNLPKRGSGVGEIISKDKKALSVAAHPYSLKRPFTGPLTDLMGIEVASTSRDSYLLLEPKNWGKLLLSIPAFFFFPQVASSLVSSYDAEALSALDKELLAGHYMRPFCGLDAHGHLGYDWELSNYHLVTMGTWPKEAGAEEQYDYLLKILKEGKAYCRSGILGDIRLNFKADLIDDSAIYSGQVQAAEVKSFSADIWPRPPYPAEMRLYKDGQMVATFAELPWRYEKPAVGAYRLEVWVKIPALIGRKIVPLFYSAPIIIGAE